MAQGDARQCKVAQGDARVARPYHLGMRSCGGLRRPFIQDNERHFIERYKSIMIICKSIPKKMSNIILRRHVYM